MEKLIEKGQSIVSSRTGKILECYYVSTIYRGVSDIIFGYEYSFIVTPKRFKSIKQNVLVEMLQGVWIVKL